MKHDNFSGKNYAYGVSSAVCRISVGKKRNYDLKYLKYVGKRVED